VAGLACSLSFFLPLDRSFISQTITVLQADAVIESFGQGGRKERRKVLTNEREKKVRKEGRHSDVP